MGSPPGSYIRIIYDLGGDTVQMYRITPYHTGIGTSIPVPGIVATFRSGTGTIPVGSYRKGLIIFGELYIRSHVHPCGTISTNSTTS